MKTACITMLCLTIPFMGCGRDLDVATGGQSCEDISCWNPSPNECTPEGTLKIHNAYGFCVEGECQYEFREEECATGSCENGVCSDMPCQGVTCSTPPDPICENGALSRWSDLGFCSAVGSQLSCVYTKTITACKNGCADGACINEPCAGVVCETPPPRYCDEENLIVWNTVGVCREREEGEEGEDGQEVEEWECDYAFQSVTCDSGCVNGACAGDPCEGIVCNSPPNAYCSDSVLVEYASSGTCVDGVCEYETSETNCEYGCGEGQCLEPTDSDTTDSDIGNDTDT